MVINNNGHTVYCENRMVFFFYSFGSELNIHFLCFNLRFEVSNK